MPTATRRNTTTLTPDEAVRRVVRAREVITTEVHKVIIGQDEMIEQMLITLLSGGHCLTIGVPGLAKTLTVSTLAKTLHLKFSRIQFTPDLMPSDITGTEIIEEDQASGRRVFRFVRGPVFSNIVLADEINRTPPKTQAALLQSMQEHQVTAGGNTYELDMPFFVMATQNPIEQEGTYPLPEAQLDRFMLSINIGYPTRDEERRIASETTRFGAAEVRQVLRARDILWIQQLVRQIPSTDHVVDYAVDLARATRPNEPESPDFVKDWLAWGAGPRAVQYLLLGAKARAILNGRYAVQADDIRALAHPVLRHRVFTNFNADAEGVTVDQIIDKLLETVPEPGYGEPKQPVSFVVKQKPAPETEDGQPQQQPAPSPPEPPAQTASPQQPSTEAAPPTEPPAPTTPAAEAPAATTSSLEPPLPKPQPTAPMHLTKPAHDPPPGQNLWPPGAEPR